ncbi:secreted RxLR effector protein 161-like [Amaranthus tricolor]|uniref:secreted RxLR effector protein 161-like n=1 Tax=Amaranthus tricolor TaxID=29722 RepID=UPI002585ABDD|nr:secreted RxLR effector protein 161-like [Amaranthus tricolor]
MKDVGPAKKILDMEIYRDRVRGKLFLTQKSYIEKILSHFGMEKSKLISTLTFVSCKLSLSMSPQTEEELAPDIAHTVSVVSMFMAQPEREPWQGVKRIFLYLRGTTDIGLVYGNCKECLVTRYSDSDYAADVDSRWSVTGYVFTLGGSVVSWKSTLQSLVTLSTTEADYMAITSAAKESIWLKGLVGELGSAQDFARRPLRAVLGNSCCRHVDLKVELARDL